METTRKDGAERISNGREPAAAAAARQVRRVVGTSVEKVDALSLATGEAVFAGDVDARGVLAAKLLFSPHAHARIRRIDISKAEALPGVHAVLCHLNVPRVMHTTAGQGYPEPSPYDTTMFDSKVRFVGDRVAAVAAETLEIAEEALERIEVDYELLEPVFDIRRATEPGAPVIHDEPDCRAVIPVAYEPKRNLAAEVHVRIGDPAGALARSDVVIDREFETHYGQHCPMETHVALAAFDEMGRLVITTSTQVPFHVRRIVAQVCGIPVSRIRVIKPRIGGGFGAKQEVLIEDVVAMLALRTRRPVRLEYSRSEEFTSSRTRHPAVMRLAAGFKRDGALEALHFYVRTNTGAYGSHALTVACNCGAKSLPLYKTENVEFHAQSVYTNLPVAGAYRGYGGTQAAFAMECVMDEAAEALGLDPLELRRRLHIRAGEGSPVFRALGEGREGVEQKIGSCGLDECIERGAAAIGWHEKRALPLAARSNGPFRRGVGAACLMQGSSIPEIDMAAASLKMNDDGSFNLLAGATDLGTGSDTVLAQIAAEVLGIEVEKVIVRSSDTDLTPFDKGAYASSTTYLSGAAVKKAAEDVAAQIREVASRMLDRDAAAIRLEGGHAVAPDGASVSLSEIALRSLYGADQRQIAAFASELSHRSPPPFAAHFAEVEVDTETGRVRVLKYVAAVDCGNPINPKLAEGQTEGAILNGISYALTEEYLFDERGRMRNPDFARYKIFSAQDVPEIVTILVPTHEPTGPFGAKSVSEISINGPLPAISNAIHHAVGVRLRHSPFAPERVLRALRQKR